MKLVTFTQAGGKGSTRIGVLDGDAVVDLSVAAPDLPREMCAFLAAGADALAAAGKAGGNSAARLALADITLEAPILRPPKILAVASTIKITLKKPA